MMAMRPLRWSAEMGEKVSSSSHLVRLHHSSRYDDPQSVRNGEEQPPIELGVLAAVEGGGV